ncbi:7TM diverse intracellular signaling domain-containing protein [Fulvivirga lutimaris]|uniref:7TM diverse intracellular signaling domain-containing protein n=1 Tax=Fulvivirga lutimaris TaxID=1819566 RepID=UPI0016252D78|nr:7TM diverse intracellular signaling domain-containing protein [Fulvivirga lutimaris]
MAFAQSELIIDDDANALYINHYLSEYRDETGEATIEKIRSLPSSNFKNLEEGAQRYGLTQDVIWLKLKLKSTLTYSKTFVFNFTDPSIYGLEMFIDKNGSIEHFLSGTSSNQSEKQIKGNKNCFQVVVHPEIEMEIYFKMYSENKMTLACQIINQSDFYNTYYRQRAYLGFFYGSMIILLIYNILMLVTTRLTVFGYYGLYVLFIAIFTGAADGYTPEFLHFLVTWKSGYLEAATATITHVLGLMFMLKFLDVHKWSIKFYWTVAGFMLFTGFAGLILLLMREQIIFDFLSYAGLIQLTLVIIGGVRGVLNKAPQAGYFLGANIVFGIFIILFILNMFRLVPYSFLVQYSIHFGYGLSVIILSFGLGVRIYSVYQELLHKEQEKQELITQKNEELEEQVTIRTNYLSEKESNLRAILDNNNNSIWFVDDQYQLIDYNIKFAESWKAFYGTELKLGVSMLDQIPVENLKSQWKIRYDSVLEGNGNTYEDNFNVAGRLKTFEINLFPIIQNEKVVGVTVFTSDITDRIEAQTILKDQNVMLTKVNQELDRFVYSASHDLKAPLASILGLINIAKVEKDDKGRQQYFEMMETSITRLDQFIKDIIDYSRNARIEIAADKIDIKNVIDGCFDDLKYAMVKDKISPNINISATAELYSDHTRLRMVIRNIISNALKYGSPKETNNPLDITVDINKERLILNIKDYGPGIAKKYHDKLFDMFFRANEQAMGTGLGLYIVKETVHRLNGKIKLKSEKNKGAEFIIEIPNMSSVSKS